MPRIVKKPSHANSCAPRKFYASITGSPNSILLRRVSYGCVILRGHLPSLCFGLSRMVHEAYELPTGKEVNILHNGAEPCAIHRFARTCHLQINYRDQNTNMLGYDLKFVYIFMRGTRISEKTLRDTDQSATCVHVP